MFERIRTVAVFRRLAELADDESATDPDLVPTNNFLTFPSPPNLNPNHK